MLHLHTSLSMALLSSGCSTLCQVSPSQAHTSATPNVATSVILTRFWVRLPIGPLSYQPLKLPARGDQRRTYAEGRTVQA